MIVAHIPPFDSVEQNSLGRGDSAPAFTPDYRAESERMYVIARDFGRIIATHLLMDCDSCPMQSRGCGATIDECEQNVFTMYAEGMLRDVIHKQW